MIDDMLNESLGIDPDLLDEIERDEDGEAHEPIEYQMEIKEVDSSIPEVVDSDMAKDYRYARNVTYTLLEKALNSLEGSIAHAKMSEHPRAYAVVNELIKSSRDLTKDLMDLQSTYVKVSKETTKKVTDFIPDGEEGSTTGVNVQGDAVVFSGTTSQLQALIKEMQGLHDEDEPEEKVIEGESEEVTTPETQ